MTRDPLVLAVSRRFKKKYIFKCAVRARLVRVTALNQLLGMSKLLCIILYFQIKTNEKIIEKKNSIFVLSLSWFNSQASCFKRKKELTHFEGRITHTGNILRTQDTHI